MRAGSLIFLFAMAPLLFSSISSSKDNTDKCMVFAYMDESGKIVKTTDKHSIPSRFLSSMISTRDCAQAQSIRKSGGAIKKNAPTLTNDTSLTQPETSTQIPSIDSSSDSYSKGSDLNTEKKIYRWFAFTEKWKVALLLLFAAAILAGAIGVVATAFHWSTAWGAACLLPPVIIVYLVFHWEKVWPSAVVWLTGMVGGSIMVFFVLSLV